MNRIKKISYLFTILTKKLTYTKTVKQLTSKKMKKI